MLLHLPEVHFQAEARGAQETDLAVQIQGHVPPGHCRALSLDV